MSLGFEIEMLLVLVGDDGGFHGPADAQGGIVVADAALVFGRIKFAGEVEDLGVVLQGHETVRAALGNVDHLAVLGGEFHGDVFEERRRFLAQVDDDIVKRAADTAERLVLAFGPELVVDAAERAALAAQGIVHLHDARIEAVLRKLAFAEKAGKEAAVIAAFLEFDDKDAFDSCFGKFHAVYVPDYINWVKTFSAMREPMASEAVAAGEGALTTCRMPRPCSK